MKALIRVSMTAAAFAAILAVSFPYNAGAFALNPALGIQPKLISEISKGRMELQAPPLFFKHSKKAKDPYAHLWETARAFSTSA